MCVTPYCMATDNANILYVRNMTIRNDAALGNIYIKNLVKGLWLSH